MATVVADHAIDGDRDRRLPDAVVDALHERGLYRLLLPTAERGRGLPMTGLFPVVEAAARLDGAVGWNLCVANVGVAAVLDRLGTQARRELLAYPHLLVAGAIRPGAVRATAEAGGWRFDGEIAFASGASHATHFLTAAAVGPANGVTLGMMRCAVAPRAAVEILDTWHASGLRGTASTHVGFGACLPRVDVASAPCAIPLAQHAMVASRHLARLGQMCLGLPRGPGPI